MKSQESPHNLVDGLCCGVARLSDDVLNKLD